MTSVKIEDTDLRTQHEKATLSKTVPGITTVTSTGTPASIRDEPNTTLGVSASKLLSVKLSAIQSEVKSKPAVQPADKSASHFHPIAIRPRPIAIAPAPSPMVHGQVSQLSSIALVRNTSTVSNKGSDEIMLTTSKEWVLPPRPRVKKRAGGTPAKEDSALVGTSPASTDTCKGNTSRQTTPQVSSPPDVVTPAVSTVIEEKEVAGETKPTTTAKPSKKTAKAAAKPKKHKTTKPKTKAGSVSINSQIHSNINIQTNNQTELQAQLQTVTRENGNLKKVLQKLNKEIQSLKKLGSPASSQESTSPLSLASPSLIDPLSLSYNLEPKRVKREDFGLDDTSRALKSSGQIGLGAVGQESVKRATFLSPKDIMINPMAMEPINVPIEPLDSFDDISNLPEPKKTKHRKTATTRKKRETTTTKKAKKKKNEIVTTKKEDTESPLRTQRKSPDDMDLDAFTLPTKPTSLKQASRPSDLGAADWYAKNSFMDFDMYNENMMDQLYQDAEAPSSLMLSSARGNNESILARNAAQTEGIQEQDAGDTPDVLPSPKFEFGFDDGFSMY